MLQLTEITQFICGQPLGHRDGDVGGAEKAAIVAESQAAGVQTSEIALRYGRHRNQLYDWRREFGTAAVGNAIAEAGAQGPDFIPVVAGVRRKDQTAAGGRLSARR